MPLAPAGGRPGNLPWRGRHVRVDWGGGAPPVLVRGEGRFPEGVGFQGGRAALAPLTAAIEGALHTPRPLLTFTFPSQPPPDRLEAALIPLLVDVHARAWRDLWAPSVAVIPEHPRDQRVARVYARAWLGRSCAGRDAPLDRHQALLLRGRQGGVVVRGWSRGGVACDLPALELVQADAVSMPGWGSLEEKGFGHSGPQGEGQTFCGRWLFLKGSD
eukprot:1181965-Prorocentrum_minimum.AAC.1